MKTLPLAIATIHEGDVIDLDDCHQVYGDGLDLFPLIDTPCENPSAPGGQCHFNAVSFEPDRCLYCKKLTG